VIARATLIALVACGARTPASSPARASAALPVAAPGALLAPAAFASIVDPVERSRAMFGEVARVLLSPRCVNCHPSDDTPHQGDAGAIHEPPIARGAADLGVPAMQCTTCHQDRNVELARVPGAPGWKLAPRRMAWQGQRPDQICAHLADRAFNGGRTLAEVRDHIAHDPLVAWGWAPGADRSPAPGSQSELAALFQAWIDSGAVCPSDPFSHHRRPT
jgi:hypothetical protein